MKRFTLVVFTACLFAAGTTDNEALAQAHEAVRETAVARKAQAAAWALAAQESR